MNEFIWSSTRFGRHTTHHHQKPKTALAASGLHTWKVAGRVVGGPGWPHCAWSRPPTTRPATFHVWRTRGCQCRFRLLLMMGGVSPETCWALYKYGLIKFWYIFVFLWIFLYEQKQESYDNLWHTENWIIMSTVLNKLLGRSSNKERRRLRNVNWKSSFVSIPQCEFPLNFTRPVG
jgi:hypothetical protein